MAASPLLRRDDPIVVLSKGHSGSRFLAQALEANDVFMGADLNPMHDSLSWSRHFAEPLIRSAWFPDFGPDEPPALRDEIDRRLEQTIEAYTAGADPSGPWGWKGSTTFVMGPLVRRFPALRLVHLIRDGRDVVLSEDGRLNLPFWHPMPRRPDRAARVLLRRLGVDSTVDDYRRRIYFGDDEAEWHGIPVRRKPIDDHRYLVQMEGWVRNIAHIRSIGAELGDRYLEIRYEDLVADPAAVVGTVIDFLGLELTPSTVRFVEEHAFRTSVRKWERTPPTGDRAADFADACAHGAALLAELGYD